MTNRRDLIKSLSALPLGLALGEGANAQAAYPSKPIKYIVPVSAGGGSDMIGRTVCERWGKVLGQTIVVDNQSGGGGVIACQNTARSAPDGYTLMQGYWPVNHCCDGSKEWSQLSGLNRRPAVYKLVALCGV